MEAQKVFLISNIRVDGEHIPKGTIIESDDRNFIAFLVNAQKGEIYDEKKHKKVKKATN